MANNETSIDTEEVIEEVKEMTEKTDIKINVEVDKKKMEESTKTLEDAFSGLKKNGHELARRRWWSQVQAQCVLRSVNEEGAPSPTRAPSIANGRVAQRCRWQMKRSISVCRGRQMTQAFAPRKLPGTAIGGVYDTVCRGYNGLPRAYGTRNDGCFFTYIWEIATPVCALVRNDNKGFYY